jgi:bacterioferritin-associated ferredoxin
LKLIMTFNTILVRGSSLLVCHCMKVCDRTIRECVERGARSVEDVGRACHAGTGCGGCQPAIRALVAGEPADAGVISLGRARVREHDAEAVPADALAS